jgi:preprotein translocase subunit SecA
LGTTASVNLTRRHVLSRHRGKRRLARWTGLLPRIAELEDALQQLDDFQLRKRSLALRFRAKSREGLDRLLPEAFALVREAGRRTLSMRHFDVQLLGGIAMHHRCIAEMQTGEGKTLTATLPLYLNALAGQGAQLATVKDYLAQRDAQWMRPIYETLGMSVGVIQSQMASAARRKAYACDVTYGTAKEFGFDFLRDRLLLRRIREGQVNLLGDMLGHASDRGSEQPVQRGANFVLVDEADSILIDEARTPLIISALPTDEQQLAVHCQDWTSRMVEQFVEKQHYEYDHDKKSIDLTAEGRQLARDLPKPPELNPVGLFDIYRYVEMSLKVNRDFQRDRHYVVRDGEIVIVDEFTGRLAEGRKWRDGIHQAIEARENLKISVATGQAARITIQELFRRYERLSGMTGTGSDSARELKKIYGMDVIPVPTNRPAIRRRLPDAIFGTSLSKWKAIAEEVREVHATGRPVLIGTRSIDKSELLSRILGDIGIEHQVLNAHRVAEEANIVANAGQRNRVTVSTNMAGRGTDIKLGEGVEELGGLHVICSEMHDAARIDRQLIGRCGRQGDPGTFCQYLALDDDILLVGLGPGRYERLKRLGQRHERCPANFVRLFRRAQQRIERKHYRDRKVLMYYEKERKKMHQQLGQDPYLDTAG